MNALMTNSQIRLATIDESRRLGPARVMSALPDGYNDACRA